MRARWWLIGSVAGAVAVAAVRVRRTTRCAAVWIATRSAMRDVLESVTLADALAGEFDAPVGDLLARPGAWERR